MRSVYLPLVTFSAKNFNMLKSTDHAVLQMVADKLGVPSSDLYNLIQFESGWNPKASSSLSSAKGLIQFTNGTAKDLGFKDSSDLIKKAPTISDQLTLVERYLMQYAPFSNTQSLFMSVFYPAARNWPISRSFPESIQRVNPGVVTVGDYMRKAGGSNVKSSSVVLFAVVAAAAYFIFTGKRK